MRFSLLGPLRVERADQDVLLGAPKLRALLALLLLRRGETVSVETLAEELWAGEPPATGTKAVRVYVGQLRKALGADVIVTESGGYTIPRDGHDLDVERFEALAAEGRTRLEDGEAELAATRLRDALALWRGPALADFRYDEFAQKDIIRLDEARLAVLETRIDADLALGREDELVPELQALVGEHPLRERLRGQLMLALYRSGRQAEALDVYREGRRLLVDELGIEPSRPLQELERAILAQDGAIGPRRRRFPSPVRPRRLAFVVTFGGAVVLASAAAAAVLALTRSAEGQIASVVAGNSLAAVDPDTGRVVAAIPVGATPVGVTVGAGGVWVLNADDQTISRVDPETKDVRTLGIGATPTDVAAGPGGVWIGNGGKLARAQFAGTTAVAVTQLDQLTGAVRTTVPLPQAGSSRSNLASNHIALAGNAVWAIAPDYSLVRIDPRRGAVTAVSRAVTAAAVAAGRGGVWVLYDDATSLARIEPRTGRASARIRVPAVGLSALAVGDGAVWATDPYQGTLWRIDPGARAVQRTIDVGVGADAVAFGGGSVWVTNSLQGTLIRIDPATNRVARTISLGNTPRAVAVGEGLVWVAVAGEGARAATHAPSAGSVRALPDTMCGKLVSGPEQPRFLVVSDLPLRGGRRFVTPQMSAAVLHVLRAHAFRADRYPLAYQSCDHSTAQSGLFDPRKCAANAKAYAANADVLGVVGPYNSGCAYAELPVASRARLPMVSPTNTDVGLTRRALGGPRNALAALYPTRHRSYVRVAAPDDAHGAAAALLARQLGVRRIFVLDDGGYGDAFSAYFKRAAGRLGVRVVGSAAWNPHAPPARRLVERVRRSKPEAVYLCGLIDTGVGEVLAAVRRALPVSVRVLGCSGLLPTSLLFEHAGPGARGTYVSIEGVATERLGAAGRRFLREFGATQSGRVDVASVYAAQATELLLDAIARSDGTRASVSAQLFRARVRDGLVGSFAIDGDGDPTPTPITFVRLQHGNGEDTVASYEGAVVDRVITPSRRLLDKTG